MHPPFLLIARPPPTPPRLTVQCPSNRTVSSVDHDTPTPPPSHRLSSFEPPPPTVLHNYHRTLGACRKPRIPKLAKLTEIPSSTSSRHYSCLLKY